MCLHGWNPRDFVFGVEASRSEQNAVNKTGTGAMTAHFTDTPGTV